MEVMFIRVPFGGATISFAVHDAHNQGERQRVATFIANNWAVKDSGGNTSNLTKHVTIQEATKT